MITVSINRNKIGRFQYESEVKKFDPMLEYPESNGYIPLNTHSLEIISDSKISTDITKGNLLIEIFTNDDDYAKFSYDALILSINSQTYANNSYYTKLILKLLSTPIMEIETKQERLKRMIK